METCPPPAEAATCILFVDDEPEVQFLYANYCRRWGYRYEGVEVPEEALAAALALHPALIFLDVMMPRVDGFDLLVQLKADPRVAGIPVIMLTGGAGEIPDKVKGLTHGAIDYLVKPLDPQEMQARIQTHLHARESHERQGRERELRAVRQTATFLNHSINNLLATIQAAAELVEDEDENSALRAELIAENVQAITEIIARLKQIRQVITTDYAGTEEMLDIEGSLGKSGDTGEPAA